MNPIIKMLSVSRTVRQTSVDTLASSRHWLLTSASGWEYTAQHRHKVKGRYGFIESINISLLIIRVGFIVSIALILTPGLVYFVFEITTRNQQEMISTLNDHNTLSGKCICHTSVIKRRVKVLTVIEGVGALRCSQLL